jgi:TctA family transporter
LALVAGAVAIAAAGFAFVGSLSADLAGFGPTASLTWHALVLLLGAIAVSVAPGGSPRRVLGAVLLGLVLGASGTDPVTPALVRFASVEYGVALTFAHGLLLALLAHHIGLNALLIALAMAVSAPIEKALRQGSLALLLDRPLVLALAAAVLAALVFLAWRRERRITAASAPRADAWERRPLLERRLFWGGAIALAGGAAGLYLGTGIDVRGPSGMFSFGPGAAPLALSGALVLIGALTLALAILQPMAADPPPAPLGSPATIGAIVFVAWLVVLLFVVPLVVFGLGESLGELMASLGPPDLVALVLFIVTMSMAAAWLMPRGTLLGALGALVIGLMLGTIGLDPATGVVRYLIEPEWMPVHGLALGFVAYRVGFNPLVIAIGFVYGPYPESNLFRTLILSEGGVAVFVERPISLALLAATLAALALAAGLRWRAPRRAPPISPPPPVS